MKRLLRRMSVLGVLLAVVAGTPAICDPLPPSTSPPDTLLLATGSVGGTFLPVGHDLAQWLNATVPGLVVVIDTTAGSVDNLERLVRGQSDIAIVAGHPFREVLRGRGTLADETQDLCTVGTLYEDAEQFVIRTSLVRAGNLLDLSGLLMYPGPHNSGGETDTRRILSALGIEPRYVYVDERDLGYTAAAQALVAGDFDACTFSGGVPIEALTDLLQSHPGEFTILPFTRHMLNRLMHYEKGFEGRDAPPRGLSGAHARHPVGGRAQHAGGRPSRARGNRWPRSTARSVGGSAHRARGCAPAMRTWSCRRWTSRSGIRPRWASAASCR